MLGNNFLKKNFTFSFILILKVNFKLKNFFTNTYKKIIVKLQQLKPHMLDNKQVDHLIF